MNIPEEAIEAAAKAAYIADNLGWDGAEAAWDDMGGSEPSYERAGWEIAARAALEAAWAVMQPEVTTRQELHALPPGTAIRSDQLGVIQKNYEGWFVPGFSEEWPIAQIPLPVTVIYRP